MPNSSSSVKWIHYIESNWTPPDFAGVAKTRSRWALAIDSHILSKNTIQGFDVQTSNRTGLSYWPKFNVCDYLWQDETTRIITPLQISPNNRIILETINGPIDFSTSIDLDDVDDIEQFPLHVRFHQDKWYATCLNDYTATRISWHVWNYGKWETHIVNIEDTMTLEIPFGELVYLEFQGIREQFPVLGRLHVVGRPGIASGRSLWNKGLHYYPRMPRPLPWTSVVFPIQHPNDVDRIPKFMTWNQSEWIIEKNIWLQDVIEQIKARDPNSKISILGCSNDNECDIIHVRPYELHSLDTKKPISFGLFSNSGELNWNQRSGWVFDIIHNEHYDHLNIIERSWLSSVSSSTNSDGQPLYGFGFSFTRNSEHADYWDGAIRDLNYRRDREALGCDTCPAKNACSQYTPTAYITNGMREYVWPIVENKCSLQLNHSKK